MCARYRSGVLSSKHHGPPLTAHSAGDARDDDDDLPYTHRQLRVILRSRVIGSMSKDGSACHGYSQCRGCAGLGGSPVNQSTASHRSSCRSSVGSERDCLVHWCHGATGVAPVLMAAADTLSRRLKEIHPLPVVTLARRHRYMHA